MDFETRQLDITQKLNGDIQLTFIVDKRYRGFLEDLNKLFADGNIKILSLKEKRQKRSLNANNYAWKLITEIANVMRKSKEETYFDMLKEYGQMVTVSVKEEAVNTFLRSVKYAEVFSEGTIDKKKFKHIHVWIGSSQYDTREMSIFIDGIVSECKDLKICTLTPQELEKIKNEWRI